MVNRFCPQCVIQGHDAHGVRVAGLLRDLPFYSVLREDANELIGTRLSSFGDQPGTELLGFGEDLNK